MGVRWKGGKHGEPQRGATCTKQSLARDILGDSGSYHKILEALGSRPNI